mgnify:CR=1 FL=1
MRTAFKWTAGLVLVLLVALALLVAFGMNLLKGPLTRAVSEATGRELVIEGDLKTLWSWTHPRFRVEQVSFANADWAREDFVFTAEAMEASVRLLPLLRGSGANTGWPDEVFVQISESQIGRCVRTHRWKYNVVAPDKNGMTYGLQVEAWW